MGPSLRKASHMAHPHPAGPFAFPLFKTLLPSFLFYPSFLWLPHPYQSSSVIDRASTTTTMQLSADNISDDSENLNCKVATAITTGTIQSSDDSEELSCKLDRAITIGTMQSSTDDISDGFENVSCKLTDAITTGTIQTSTEDISDDSENLRSKFTTTITTAATQLSANDSDNLNCKLTASIPAGTIQNSADDVSDDSENVSCKLAGTIRTSAEDISDNSENLSCKLTVAITTGSIQKSADDISDDSENLSTGAVQSSAGESNASRAIVGNKQSSPSTKPFARSSALFRCSINRIKPDGSNRTTLGMGDIRFVRRVGSGDIGSVYVAEVKGSGWEGRVFAAKVMDKEELVSRKKEGRARIEREILEMLDHPFLPRLYAAIESPRWSCLLTEFCPGGDLHVLRQRQPLQRFHEDAVRFYASEVVIALEYLHMMGIIYRDLKPENVLIRLDGHIMLTDFDLSLKSHDSSSSAAQIVSNHHPPSPTYIDKYATDQSSSTTSSCILPNCIVPAVSCLQPKRNRKKKKSTTCGSLEIVAEPIEIRSMSFVGTHEYLAPEIVSGEGHGNAVDWWTLGVFMYELLYGITPFKGLGNELTLANIMARALEFPKELMVAESTKDLIAKLLVKDPTKRLGSTIGATAIKHHPYFNGVNWALLRCASPPYMPPPTVYKNLIQQLHNGTTNEVDYY